MESRMLAWDYAWTRQANWIPSFAGSTETLYVVPAEAGTHSCNQTGHFIDGVTDITVEAEWIPAFAGMTRGAAYAKVHNVLNPQNLFGGGMG